MPCLPSRIASKPIQILKTHTHTHNVRVSHDDDVAGRTCPRPPPPPPPCSPPPPPPPPPPVRALPGSLIVRRLAFGSVFLFVSHSSHSRTRYGGSDWRFWAPSASRECPPILAPCVVFTRKGVSPGVEPRGEGVLGCAGSVRALAVRTGESW